MDSYSLYSDVNDIMISFILNDIALIRCHEKITYKLVVCNVILMFEKYHFTMNMPLLFTTISLTKSVYTYL